MGAVILRTTQAFILGAILVLSVGVASFAASQDVAPQDDAYHFAGGQHAANYVEWWYFNLSAPQQGFHFVCTYSIIDPQNRTRSGAASVLAAVYTPRETFHESALFAPEAFEASDEKADLSFGENKIQAIDGDSYRIVGSIAAERHVAWDLLYVREMPPWFAREREQVGRLPWEQMSWLIYMPRAKVSGTVWVDDEVHELDDAAGYHDHNWGEWVPGEVVWNWAQYTESGLAFEMGDFRNAPVGVVGIDHQGTRALFQPNQYTLKHSRWTFDVPTQRWVPLQSLLLAENDDFILQVELSTMETRGIEPPVDIPFLRFEPLIYEQTALFRGRLLEKTPGGEPRLVATFTGPGFKEYTARKKR